MATAVVLNLPEHGHMNATFPLAAELVRRGERVVYFATEPWRAAVEATGAHYVSYGDPAAFAPPAHKGGLYSVMAWLTSLAEEILPPVLRRLRDERPDYLLVDSMCIWGNYAQQLLGKPAVTLASVFLPDLARVSTDDLVRTAYERAPKEVILAGIEALDQYFRTTRRIDREHGTLSPDLAGFFANRQALHVLFTSRQFHVGGEHFDRDFVFVGPSVDARGDEDLPFELPRKGPLVYISLGTIFNERPDFYRACIKALGNAPYDVVVSGASAEQLGPVPRNFIVRESVPQIAVLQRAAVFLTHAGMNSANEALWHGVPMVLHPQHGDQHLVAARIVELGAGERLEPGASALHIRAVVDLVAGDGRYRHVAWRIGRTLREAGGARRAADAIAAFTERARG
jgi:MGT family glycosyltransferase